MRLNDHESICFKQLEEKILEQIDFFDHMRGGVVHVNRLEQRDKKRSFILLFNF
jgi:hypothetical protein